MNHTTAVVLHAIPPNFFGNAPITTTDYSWVARKTFPDAADDITILNELFEQTNTIDAPWFEIAQHRGLTIRIDHVSMPVGQRSTSVGDVIRISDASGDRYFLCAIVGWEPLDRAFVREI